MRTHFVPCAVQARPGLEKQAPRDEAVGGVWIFERSDQDIPRLSGGWRRDFEIEIACEELGCDEASFALDGAVVFDEAEDSLKGHNGHEWVLGRAESADCF